MGLRTEELLDCWTEDTVELRILFDCRLRILLEDLILKTSGNGSRSLPRGLDGKSIVLSSRKASEGILEAF